MHSQDFNFLSEKNLLGLSIKSYETLAWRLWLFEMSIVQCWYTDSYTHSSGHILFTNTLIPDYCISETNGPAPHDGQYPSCYCTRPSHVSGHSFFTVPAWSELSCTFPVTSWGCQGSGGPWHPSDLT